MKNRIYYFIFATTVLCAGEVSVTGIDEIIISEQEQTGKIKSLDGLHAVLTKEPGIALSSDQIDFNVLIDYLEVRGKKITIFSDGEEEGRAVINAALENHQQNRGPHINFLLSELIKDEKARFLVSRIEKDLPISVETASESSEVNNNDPSIIVFEAVSGMIMEYLGRENQDLKSANKKEKKSHTRQRLYLALGSVLLSTFLTIVSGYVGNQMNTCSS